MKIISTIKNKSTAKILGFTALLSNSAYTFAQGCSLGSDDAPSVQSIACVLGTILAIMIYVAAGVFVAMIAYTAVKLAMAKGDAKGYEGAKNTATYAVIGIAIILGIAGIFSIIGQLFGISFADPWSMIAKLESAITDIFTLATQGE